MRGKEDNLQKACVTWFKLAYPTKLIIHCPNGGKRNAREAAKFKAMGVLSGVSDLLIFEPNSLYHGLAVELKVKGNTTTDNQKDFLEQISKRGWKIAICYSLDEFMATVVEYLSIKEKETFNLKEIMKQRGPDLVQTLNISGYNLSRIRKNES